MATNDKCPLVTMNEEVPVLVGEWSLRLSRKVLMIITDRQPE